MKYIKFFYNSYYSLTIWPFEGLQFLNPLTPKPSSGYFIFYLEIQVKSLVQNFRSLIDKLKMVLILTWFFITHVFKRTNFINFESKEGLYPFFYVYTNQKVRSPPQENISFKKIG